MCPYMCICIYMRVCVNTPWALHATFITHRVTPRYPQVLVTRAILSGYSILAARSTHMDLGNYRGTTPDCPLGAGVGG